MGRKKSIKKSEDLNELLSLAKVPTHTNTYNTVFGQTYEITFDDVFTAGKLKEAINDYMVINMCINKFKSEERIEANTSLLFAICVQKFTDKDFVMGVNDPMDRFQRYVVVSQTLNKIELDNGNTLLQQIIIDFGEDNLNKLAESTGAFNASMAKNKDKIIEILKEVDNNEQEVQES